MSFAVAQADEVNIIPRPLSVSAGKGSFTINKATKIHVFDPNSRKSAELFNDVLQKKYGFRLKVTDKYYLSNAIVLQQFGPSHGRPVNTSIEYGLFVEPNSIDIRGNDRGHFYGLQTLIQMLPDTQAGKIRIPAVTILDGPRFPYRGMHLDVSRHFFPVEFVKKYIDLMSQYKFNYFHWHLTDDQGWRIEIKKYPRLTEVGSKRPETMKEKNTDPYIGDGVPVEGFYTQEQIRDVVAYAKARYITVIPEIELPGHSSAALAAYPELGCKADYEYEVKKTWGIFKEVYCPTEKTFGFLEDVLTETVALFPDSPYIHIGGDEVLKDHWKESPEVKALMEKEGLKDEHEVQSYFVRRMEKVVNKLGKRIIGWDEILEGGLAPDATVMSWRGIKGGIEAAKAKHDVIMTPTDFCYLDYGQGDPATEPLNIGGYLPLEKVYSFDPIPKELSADEAKYIIGGQGNIWTEFLPTPASVEYMAFPRMLALSEAVWSMPENNDYQDFTRRLMPNLARLDRQNVNYRIPSPRNLQNAVVGDDENFRFENIASDIPGAKVFYTTDGTSPNPNSALMPASLDVTWPTSNVVTLKTTVVLPSGRQSSIYVATAMRRPWLEPSPDVKEKRLGATYAFSVLGGSMMSGETKTFVAQQFAKTADIKQPFSMAFDGFFNVSTDEIYEFQAESPWDVSVIIDGEKVVDATGTGKREFRDGVLPLRSGLHKISIRYNHRGGEPTFRIRWGVKGQGLRTLGAADLIH